MSTRIVQVYSHEAHVVAIVDALREERARLENKRRKKEARRAAKKAAPSCVLPPDSAADASAGVPALRAQCV
jgi:hypothetical protein